MILSLFPGIGILDHAFELEGFTVVRGPDLLWGELEDCCELQGLPTDFFKHSPFTRAKQRQMLGNAVPLPMGRVVARAIRAALGLAAPAEEKPPPQGSSGEGQGSRVSVDTRSAGVPSLPARAGCVAAGQASPGGT